MIKIAIIGVLQQQAEALGTQFPPVYAIYNDKEWNTNINEMVSSKNVIYIPYHATDIKHEIYQILKVIGSISPNIIYINSLRQLGVIGLFIRLSYMFSKRPILIATSHNSVIWKSNNKRFLLSVICKLLADGVLTLAKYQEQILIKYGVQDWKIKTIPNPVDTDLFSPDPSRFRNPADQSVLINIGEINPIKNQETIIKSLELVKKELPHVKLLLTGGRIPDYNYNHIIESVIRNSDVLENVSIIGYKNHLEIPKLLRTSDISLLSSVSEVCPFTILESLASGKVTIATSVGGIPDLIENGVNGFLVKPGDIDGFAKCILQVLKDNSLRTYIEANARKSAVSNFSYQAIGEKHREFIYSLVNKIH